MPQFPSHDQRGSWSVVEQWVQNLAKHIPTNVAPPPDVGQIDVISSTFEFLEDYGIQRDIGYGHDKAWNRALGIGAAKDIIEAGTKGAILYIADKVVSTVVSMKAAGLSPTGAIPDWSQYAADYWGVDLISGGGGLTGGAYTRAGFFGRNSILKTFINSAVFGMGYGAFVQGGWLLGNELFPQDEQYDAMMRLTRKQLEDMGFSDSQIDEIMAIVTGKQHY